MRLTHVLTIAIASSLLAALPAHADRVVPLVDGERVMLLKDGKPTTIDKVKQAILAGSATRGWRTVETPDAKVRLSLSVRTHNVVVDVLYSAEHFQIKYVSSVNLLYSGSDQDRRIHRSYVTWTKNLENDILSAFLRM